MAEEIAQETFYNALKNISKYNPEMKMLTWLCTIAKNTYFTEIKKQSRCEVLDDDIISEESIIDNIIIQEESSEILQIVHQLEEPYKKVFSLRTFGDYSFKQIGDYFKKTESWARVTYHRSKSIIKERLENDVDEKAAFQNFNKKMMKNNVKKVITGTVAVVAVIAMVCVGMYVPTKNVKWSEDLVTVATPEDDGLDIRINARDYKNAYATYALDENGDATIYLTVEQNLLSAFVTKGDEAEKIIRIGNNICVSYHNADHELQFHLPENTRIKEIYYVQADQSTLQEFAEGNTSGIVSHFEWSK